MGLVLVADHAHVDVGRRNKAVSAAHGEILGERERDAGEPLEGEQGVAVGRASAVEIDIDVRQAEPAAEIGQDLRTLVSKS